MKELTMKQVNQKNLRNFFEKRETFYLKAIKDKIDKSEVQEAFDLVEPCICSIFKIYSLKKHGFTVQEYLRDNLDSIPAEVEDNLIGLIVSYEACLKILNLETLIDLYVWLEIISIEYMPKTKG